MKNQRNKRGGYTIIELALSIGLLLLVVGAPVRFMETAAEAQRELDAVTDLNARASRAVERITQRLQGAAPTKVSPPGALLGSAAIDFEVAASYGPGGIGWAGLETIRVVPSPTDPNDGIDNDGDGLVDEVRVEWESNGSVHVLCENVSEFAAGEIPGNGLDDNGNGLSDEAGFILEWVGSLASPPTRVRLYLTLAKMTPEGELLEVTIEQSIALRCRKP